MKIHMVKSGDSMYTIAQKHGVDLDQLIAFNPQISNPDQIDVGMKVKIPTAALVHDGNSGVEYAHKHVVVQGDSLWKISKAWGLSLKEMVDANPQLKNPSVLLTGEIVNIPKQVSPSAAVPIMNPSMDYANMSGLGNAGALAPIMNTVSPANVPQLVNNIPQLSENISQLSDNIPQFVSEAPAQIPVSSPVNLPEAPQLLQMTLPTEKLPMEEKQMPKNESIEIYSGSTNLFAQFNVPAMEVQAKQEQHESYPMPEFTEMPQWPTSPPFPAEQPMAYTSPYGKEQPMTYSSPYGKEQPMTYLSPYGTEQPMAYTSPYGTEQPMAYTSPYGKEQPMTYVSPYGYEQPMTDPYSAYYAPKAGCGCGCGGQKNVGSYMHTEPPYAPLPNYYMPHPMQPMESMMPYSFEQPMPMQQPMQQPITEYPQWSPYAANAAFSPTNMMYPTVESPYSFYGYMSPCYPIFPPAQMSYLGGMQAPYSPLDGPKPSSFKDAEERIADQSSPEQEQDLAKTSAIEGSSTKIKVPRKSSNRNSQSLDDRVILHNFLQQKATNNDSFRESKSNEPWINR